MVPLSYLGAVLSNGKLNHGEVGGGVAAFDALHRGRVDLQLAADLGALDEVFCFQVLHTLELPVGQLDDGALDKIRGERRGEHSAGRGRRSGGRDEPRQGRNDGQMELGLDHPARSWPMVRAAGGLQTLSFEGHGGDVRARECGGEFGGLAR